MSAFYVADRIADSNSGRGPHFVLKIRGQTDQSNIKQNKVFKYIEISISFLLYNHLQ